MRISNRAIQRLAGVVMAGAALCTGFGANAQGWPEIGRAHV